MRIMVQKKSNQEQENSSPLSSFPSLPHENNDKTLTTPTTTTTTKTKTSSSSSLSSLLLQCTWFLLTKCNTRNIIKLIQKIFSSYRDTLFYFSLDQFDCFDNDDDDDNDDKNDTLTLKNENKRGEETKNKMINETTTTTTTKKSGLFAITIDDGFTRSSSSSSSSLIPQVSSLLSSYNATATFFICSDYTVHSSTIVTQARTELLLKGKCCEFGCHMKNDDCGVGHYVWLKEEEWKEEFMEEWRRIEWLKDGQGEVWMEEEEEETSGNKEKGDDDDDDGSDDNCGSAGNDGNHDLVKKKKQETERIQLEEDNNNYNNNNEDDDEEEIRWFRSPQALYTSSMRSTLASLSSSSQQQHPQQHPQQNRPVKYIHVLGDAYCDDWKLSSSNPKFVAQTMLRQIQPGSIAIFHMPEKEFRRGCLNVLEMVLEGAKERGLRGVSLSELWRRRKQQQQQKK